MTPVMSTFMAVAAAAAPFSVPTTIDNTYLPLSKWKSCELRGVQDDGTRERNTLTRLKRTRAFSVDGQRVETLIIRDRAYEDGRLVEDTLDYFAQAEDGTVHYFGEHVDNIRRGRVVNHHGSWLYGRDTDVLGVIMPRDPQVGDQWRSEDVPRITIESDRLEETGLRARAGGKLYTEVIRVSEFTQPEGEIEYKLYAPGVGVITEYAPEGRMVLRHCVPG
jgi:hypothetical protein